nr:reverse transcriptase domain-containing protein [Tanacetum cinerariifolium]
MAVRTQPTLSLGISARVTEAMALSPSSFCKRYRSSYETLSSSGSSALSLTLPIQNRYQGTSKPILDTKTKEDESEAEGTGLESEESKDEGPGSKSEDVASKEQLPTRLAWVDPKDGTVYIDIEFDAPPVRAPVHTPASPEWSSGYLLFLPPSLTVPSPVASPVTTLAATTEVDEGEFLDVGAQLELHGSILNDHTHRLNALLRILFEWYGRDFTRLFASVGKTNRRQRAVLWQARYKDQREILALGMQHTADQREMQELRECVVTLERRMNRTERMVNEPPVYERQGARHRLMKKTSRIDHTRPTASKWNQMMNEGKLIGIEGMKSTGVKQENPRKALMLRKRKTILAGQHISYICATIMYVNIFSGEATTKFSKATEMTRGGILADATGLGKTVTTISLILARPSKGTVMIFLAKMLLASLDLFLTMVDAFVTGSLRSKLSRLVRFNKGDAEHYTKAWMNFMIVRSPSPYNGIIGRSGIIEIQAVSSTAHRMLKFSVNDEIVTIRSTTLTPTECATIAATPKDSAKKTKARHKNFKPSDKTGVPRLIVEHRLDIREGYSPVRQKKRGQAPKRANAIRVEVQTLVEARILREVYYHDWLSNSVMVRKHDGSWRIRVDFKDLNKVRLQDCYPLSEIDWKVESLCGNPFKCFLDAYKGYHQIQMAEQDEEKTIFHTSHGVYCYTKMPFGLKNAGATYQQLVDMAFDRQIGWNLEIYVDDLVIKSHTKTKLLRDIEEIRRNVSRIYDQSERNKTVPRQDEGRVVAPIPTTIKEVQSLNRKLASLNRFLSKSAEKSLPLFKTLKKCIKKSDFHWMPEAEQAFKQLKHHLAKLPTLVAPKRKKDLIMYLSASYRVISAVLMNESVTSVNFEGGEYNCVLPINMRDSFRLITISCIFLGMNNTSQDLIKLSAHSTVEGGEYNCVLPINMRDSFRLITISCIFLGMNNTSQDLIKLKSLLSLLVVLPFGLSPVSGALSPFCADLIPSHMRVRDFGYFTDVEVDPKETNLKDDVMVRSSDEPHLEQDINPEIQAEINECFAYANALRDRGIDARVVVEAVMAILVILVSSDLSEDSVRTSAGRGILFGTIPTTTPHTTRVITPPTNHTDTTVTPTEIPTVLPTILPTIPPSPDYTHASPDYLPTSPNYSPASPDYSHAFNTESDPSEDLS